MNARKDKVMTLGEVADAMAAFIDEFRGDCASVPIQEMAMWRRAIAARDAKVEVTDAMVERAAKAYWNCSTSDLLRKRLRAALKAALAKAVTP